MIIGEIIAGLFQLAFDIFFARRDLKKMKKQKDKIVARPLSPRPTSHKPIV